jgi:hypothetical protein
MGTTDGNGVRRFVVRTIVGLEVGEAMTGATEGNGVGKFVMNEFVGL